MHQFLTDNINISVKPQYREQHSDPQQRNYIFSYQITIENNSNESIQLLSRHWFIYDSDGRYSEVEGKGVIGKQPTIEPYQNFVYESFCHLKTDIGWMWGSYHMKQVVNAKKFMVEIPEFELIRPVRLN